MNSRLKGIVTVILIVIIGLVAVSGIGYIRQRMAADQGRMFCFMKERHCIRWVNITKQLKFMID